jgi:hypothetical protein
MIVSVVVFVVVLIAVMICVCRAVFLLGSIGFGFRLVLLSGLSVRVYKI